MAEGFLTGETTDTTWIKPFGSDWKEVTYTAVDGLAIYPTAADGGITTHNGGGDFFGVGGYFALSGSHAGVLLSMLPPIVRKVLTGGAVAVGKRSGVFCAGQH